jgi:hypothetical protein
MLTEVRAYFDRRAGDKLASEEINDLQAGYRSPADIEERRRGGRLGQETINSEFRTGWKHGWQSLGAYDARQGFCAADRYLCKEYNRGWIEQVLEFAKSGWKNPSIEQHLNEVLDGKFDYAERS